jgi:hypothetical protein
MGNQTPTKIREVVSQGIFSIGEKTTAESQLLGKKAFGSY